MLSDTQKQKIELAWIFERVVHKYNLYEKQVRDYGTGQKLTQNEIHALSTIEDKEGLSLGELAHLRGVTKGAMSQLVSRLSKKELLQKKPSPASEAQIALYLTLKGKQACKGHKDYHRGLGATIDEQLFSEFSSAEYTAIIKSFARFEELLDKELEANQS